MATGFGLRLVGRIGGGEPSIRPYSVPATDGTALYQGDVVELVNTMDAAGELPTVTQATTAHVLLGVVVGFKPDASLPYTGQYRAASTARVVYVCDDPNAIYEIQEDAAGGAIAAATIGEMENCPIIVAAGSTVTGLSGTMLDSSQVTVSASDCKIIGVRRDGVNAAAQSGGAVILVRILSADHALVATDSRS